MNSVSTVKQFAFTAAQIAKLMDMQDQLNTYIHQEWISQQFNWRLAMVDECMEIHGHLGWKWWRPNYQLGMVESNVAQIKLEVIDLLHFVMSQTLVDGYSNSATMKAFNAPVYSVPQLSVAVDEFMADCLNESPFIRFNWALLAHCVDLTEQEILETYTQKYVLNKFRQDHGYKDGSYVKEWECLVGVGKLVDGVATDYMSQILEDNEVLAEIVTRMKAVGMDSTDEIELYSNLSLRYHSRLNK